MDIKKLSLVENESNCDHVAQAFYIKPVTRAYYRSIEKCIDQSWFWLKCQFTVVIRPGQVKVWSS